MTVAPEPDIPARFYVETLGCPKNAVDSDKVTASLLADGLVPASSAEEAELVVVNTCAFVEAARQESIDVTLALAEARKPGAKLVVTGCLAERYGEELATALPEADAVVGFGGEGGLAEVVLKRKPAGVRDLLELPRPEPAAPWAYVKVAEGCDRACAFCAIPSFRGKQRSRAPETIEEEARALVESGAAELVLVAQDLAWYGRDAGQPGSLAPLLRRLDALSAHGLARIRLLYLYPSEVRDPLVSTMLELPTVVPYFDLSLQHASAPLLRRMKRWGSGDRFRDLIDGIRAREPDAAFRSSFIVGYPGETEDDFAATLDLVDAVGFDTVFVFMYSPRPGTAALRLGDDVADAEKRRRFQVLNQRQQRSQAGRNAARVGSREEVLVDSLVAPGRVAGRTRRFTIVHLDGPSALLGRRIHVDVTGAGPNALVGRLPADDSLTPSEAAAVLGSP